MHISLTLSSNSGEGGSTRNDKGNSTSARNNKDHKHNIYCVVNRE